MSHKVAKWNSYNLEINKYQLLCQGSWNEKYWKTYWVGKNWSQFQHLFLQEYEFLKRVNVSIASLFYLPSILIVAMRPSLEIESCEVASQPRCRPPHVYPILVGPAQSGIATYLLCFTLNVYCSQPCYKFGPFKMIL